MSKENFDPKLTTCGYNIVCKGQNDCQIRNGVDHQLIKSVEMEYKVGNRTIKWTKNDAENFLKRSVMTAGNCPMAEDIQTRGQELIKNKFGSSF